MHLMQEHLPEVAKHLFATLIFPETFTVKWFAGLFVQILPFDVLCDFFDNFLKDGIFFIFRFCLAVVDALQPKLLQTKEVGALYALLRLDKAVVLLSDDKECLPNVTQLHPKKLFERAAQFSFPTDFILQTSRKQLFDQHLAGNS